MKKLLLFSPLFLLLIGCPPSGEPHSGPNGFFSRSQYMLGTYDGGASMYFIDSKPFEWEAYGLKHTSSINTKYIANIYGPTWPDEKCQSKGSYSYNPETYIITVYDPDNTTGVCPDVDDPSPAGEWIYKGSHIISPSGKKFYYTK